MIKSRNFRLWITIVIFGVWSAGLACGLRPASVDPTPPGDVPAATATPLLVVVVTPTPTAIRADASGATPTPPPTLRPADAGSQPQADTPTPLPAVKTPLAPPSGGTGRAFLFGPFHLPEAEFGLTYPGAFRSLRPNEALAVLEAARAAKISLIINLAGSRRRFQEADGAFSPARFNEILDRYQPIDFAPYVADGTIIGHMLFDEPQDPSNWNGSQTPYADIEAVAAHSKALWPTMPVGVAGPPSFLQGGAPWSALDFGFAQYTTQRGDVAAWLSQEVGAAQQTGLGLVLSINVLGGNNRSPVTAAQLAEWGALFVAEPRACGLLMWRYDDSYFQNPDVAGVVASLAQAAQGRAAASCQP